MTRLDLWGVTLALMLANIKYDDIVMATILAIGLGLSNHLFAKLWKLQ